MRKSVFCFMIVLAMVLLPCGIFGATATEGDSVWVIKFKSNISTASAARIVDNVQGDSDLESLGKKNSQYFTTTDSSVAKEFENSGLCEYVEETGVSYATTAPNDPLYAKITPETPITQYQYALEMLHAERAWAKTLGSSTVKIVVIDSGFDYTHEDGANIHAGYDYITDSTNTKDYDNHGTACAGIIGATYNNSLGIAGAASGCNVTMLRCFIKKENVLSANNAHIAAAIRDAVDVYDADIISMSFGSRGNDTVMKEAVDYAYNKGAIMVASTGNSGVSGSPLEYPAAYSKVIGVGAVDVSKDVASFSTQNKSTFVVAPGSNILSLAPDQKYDGTYNGTSFAAPYVSALAALGRSLDSNLSPAEFSALLQATSTDLGAPGYDYSYGYGLIDYGAFIDKMENRSFVDVADDAWYANAVYTLKNSGIITGRTLYTYCPEEKVTRGEFVALLARMSKDDLSGFHYKSNFDDVPVSLWCNPVINWAYNKKIVEGVSATSFSPDTTITREEMATMLCRYLVTQGVTVADKGISVNFSDKNKISAWAKQQVTTLTKAGLLKGFEDNTFRPAADTTRAEAAVLLERITKL